MADCQQPYLIAENLGYETNPARTLFEGVYLSLSAKDRIALVGSNGAGKSTLLQILASQKPPTRGTVTCAKTIYYLPQMSVLRASISQQSVLDTVSDLSEEWWEIIQYLETTFGTTLDLSATLQSLSGGELTQLFLAAGLARSPDLLFLDEPTNHLDYRALEALCFALHRFSGAFVIASHRPFFLDRVTETTWELTSEGLQVYGGSFSLYREQKQRDRKAKVRSHETARKALKRAKATALSEQKRAARSSRSGRHNALNGGIPRIVAGNLQRKAESVAGKQKVKYDSAIAVAAEKVENTKVKTHRIAKIQLERHPQKSRTLLDVTRANLWVGDRLLIGDISLRLSSGDRIAVAGPNGSGKSCLARAVLRHNSERDRAFLQGGEVRLTATSTVYLDQNYGLVDRRQTVLENMRRANPTLSYQQVRQQLGHFLFFGDRVRERASSLSGGELAKLAIAMITVSTIDLLILDEPTNNLDISTVEQIIEALQGFQGALLAISHDLDFLSRIGITRAFKIKDGTLAQTTYLPDEQSLYHSELLMT